MFVRGDVEGRKRLVRERGAAELTEAGPWSGGIWLLASLGALLVCLVSVLLLVQSAGAAGPSPSFQVTPAGPGVPGLSSPTDLADVLLGENVSLKSDPTPKVNQQAAGDLPPQPGALPACDFPDEVVNCSPLPSFGVFSNGATDLGIEDGLLISSNASAESFGTDQFVEGIAANRPVYSVVSYNTSTRLLSISPSPVSGTFLLKVVDNPRFPDPNRCVGEFGPYAWDVTAATIAADFQNSTDTDCREVTVTGSVATGFTFGGTAATKIYFISAPDADNSLLTGIADADALGAVTSAAGLGGRVNNTTSLSFELEPPAPGEGRYLKFEYSLLVTERGEWDGSAWSGEVFDYPDGFALFTDGTAPANNCAVVPKTSTYLSMNTAGVVAPQNIFADGKAQAGQNLQQLIDGGPNDGLAFPTGETIDGSWTEDSSNSNWAVQFLTVPLTCVSQQVNPSDSVPVEIVVGDLNDGLRPNAAIFKASSVRWSNNPNPSALETLTVTKTGTGSGTVSSAPAGIDCGQTCSGDFDASATVTLTATPASGSAFTGWSGACSGTGTCEVAMNQSREVTATFNATAAPRLSITKFRPGPRRLNEKKIIRMAWVRCESGTCRIDGARMSFRARGKTFPGTATYSKGSFPAGERRLIKTRVPDKVNRQLRARKSGVAILRVRASASRGQVEEDVSKTIKQGLIRCPAKLCR